MEKDYAKMPRTEGAHFRAEAHTSEPVPDVCGMCAPPFAQKNAHLKTNKNESLGQSVRVCAHSRESRQSEFFNPLAVVLDFGLQPVVDDAGRLRVFGFSAMAPDDARKAAAYIREYADLITGQILAIEVFKTRVPGYCQTCPAYARGWEILINGKRHSDWCCYSSWFLGKAAKPIPLYRYEPGIDAFKLKTGRCPRLEVQNEKSS